MAARLPIYITTIKIKEIIYRILKIIKNPIPNEWGFLLPYENVL